MESTFTGLTGSKTSFMPLGIRLDDMRELGIGAGKRSAEPRRTWRGVLADERGTKIHSTYLMENGGLLDITLELRVTNL